MIEEEALLLVVVERRAVELLDGLTVQIDGGAGQIEPNVAVVGAPGCGEAESERAASAREGDA